MTALSRLIATMAAQRLGLTPTLAPLDRPSFHVDGRYTRAEEPETNGMHLPRGYSRNPRPDLNQVMLDLRVEHPAGIPNMGMGASIATMTFIILLTGVLIWLYFSRRQSADM